MSVRKIKTPNGMELEVKEYLNTKERNEIRKVFMKYSTFDKEGGVPKIDQISGEATDEAEAKMIEVAIISYGESSEKILERLLEGDPKEYDFVVAEAAKALHGNFPQSK